MLAPLTQVILLACLVQSQAAPRPLVVSRGDKATVINYLSKYGYLKGADRNNANISHKKLSAAVRHFQERSALAETGVVDAATEDRMNEPRCGVMDVVEKVGIAPRRRRRYVLQGSRWRNKTITYKITRYPGNTLLDSQDVDLEVRKAFTLWAEYAKLEFKEKKEGHVNINISFLEGDHGDDDPFDGRGGTLAHGYFPLFGGDTHFDQAEYWTVNSFKGTNLLVSAAHEFGHALGLSHSKKYEALMAPFYRGYERDLHLDQDDIAGITRLYGAKLVDARPRASTSRKVLCSSARIDTIVTLPDKVTYVFKDDSYWQLSDVGIQPGFPQGGRSIFTDWDGLPGNLDAAFSWVNGKTYFFKGSRYWRFTGRRMDPEYPKKIRQGFPNIPDNVDAAIVWKGNKKLYFFKGSEYWKFDPESVPPVVDTYPRPIFNWEGVPDNLDAALLYSNGHNYFFKGGYYYRFDDRSFRVEAADPAYPRPSSYWWFGCEKASPLVIKDQDVKQDSHVSLGDVEIRGLSPGWKD